MNQREDGSFDYDPEEMAQEIAAQVSLDKWRVQCRKDEDTARWAHLFDRLEPNNELLSMLVRGLIMVTHGSIAPQYLYGRLLAAWTYGMAEAFSKLADEDITLWEGAPPLDFPDWDNVVEPPPTPPTLGGGVALRPPSSDRPLEESVPLRPSFLEQEYFDPEEYDYDYCG